MEQAEASSASTTEGAPSKIARIIVEAPSSIALRPVEEMVSWLAETKQEKEQQGGRTKGKKVMRFVMEAR
jgi:hypothetical protein